MYKGEVFPPGAPYCRPITAVDVNALPGSGATLTKLISATTVITRVSARTGDFAGVVVFAVSTTFMVIVLAPADTVVAPLSHVRVVAAGVHVIHAGIAGVVNVLPPSPPETVYSGGDCGAIPYVRPTTAVEVAAVAGSGTTLTRIRSVVTVITRVSFTGAVVDGVVEFAVSTTLIVAMSISLTFCVN